MDHHKRSKIRRRTLVIGLGGTGTQSIGYLLRRLKTIGVITSDNTFSQDEPIRVLAFDTDEMQETIQRFKEFESLINNQFFQLDQLKIEKKVMALTAPENQEYGEWLADLNNTYIKSRNARHGAGQWRPLGRLAYCEEQTKIEHEIEKAFNKIRSYHCEEHKLDSRDIDVIVVSSLAGGTGSGLLLDVVYYLQRNFIEHDSNTRVNTYAYLLLPDAFLGMETGNRVEPNTYAALKEINAFYRQKEDFEMTYPIGGKRRIPKGTALPFTSVYLFDKELSACKHLETADDCYRYMSSVIYLKMVSSLTQRARSVFANERIPDKRHGDQKTTSSENGYVFSACSGSIVEFPSMEKIVADIKLSVKKYLSREINTDGSQCEKSSEFENNVKSFFTPENKAMVRDLNYFWDQRKKVVEVIDDTLFKRIDEAQKGSAFDYGKKIDEVANEILHQFEKVLEEEDGRTLLPTQDQTLIQQEVSTKARKRVNYQSSWKRIVNEGPKELARAFDHLLKEKLHQVETPHEKVLCIKKMREFLVESFADVEPGDTSEDVSRVHEKIEQITEESKDLDDTIGAILDYSRVLQGPFTWRSPVKWFVKRMYARLLRQPTVNHLKHVANRSTSYKKHQTQVEAYLANMAKKEFIDHYLNPLIAELAELEGNYEDISRDAERFVAETTRASQTMISEEEDLSGRRRLLNELQVGLSDLYDPDELNGFIKDCASTFMTVYDEKVQEHLKVDDAVGGTLAQSQISFLGTWIDEYLKERVRVGDPFIARIRNNGVLDKIELALKASRISVFTNLKTHSLNQDRVFWAFPATRHLEHIFKEGSRRILEQTEQMLEHVFSGVPAESIKGLEEDKIVIYFETHHHPSENIKGIRKYQREYYNVNFPRELLHIHLRYVRLDDLVAIQVVPDATVRCGNPGCTTDITKVPRDVHFCPGCNETILNRCGNKNCTEDRLLQQVGGLKNYATHSICPSCRQGIKTYKWRCDKGHGPQLRKPHDPYCPECTRLAKHGDMPFEDRGRRKDDKRYRDVCLGCIEKGIDDPLKIPVPEWINGVPTGQEVYVKEKLRESGIINNTCYKCGSKIYPECMGKDGQLHFLEMDEKGHPTCCDHSPYGQDDTLYHCYHCEYPMYGRQISGQHVIHCPRCQKRLHRCHQCTEVNHYLIDETTLDRTDDRCPVCHYMTNKSGR